MGEQQINVAEELKLLEGQIGRIMADAAKLERSNAEKDIQKLSRKIEEILNQYGTAPRAVIARTVERVNDQMVDLVGREVVTVRQSEYNETRTNIGMITGEPSEEMLNTLAYFGQSGIVQQDGKYQNTVEDVCNRVVDAYRKPLEASGTRSTEDAYMKILNAANFTKNNLVLMHEEYTRTIKRDVMRQVDVLGMKINSSLEQKIEQTVESSVATLTEFEKTLKDGTVSKAEQAQNDAKELSDNEDAFRETVEPRETAEKMGELGLNNNI